jgi:hypothetical protein
MSDQELSDIESNENKSTSSTLSASKVTLECPDCKKELQSRHMFNHIVKSHPEYFLSMMRVYKENDLNELIKNKSAIPLEWEYNNDFDETEFKNIWGCLGCNSSFTVEHKANHHTCKDKCKAKHIAAIKQIIKNEKKEKEKRDKQTNTLRMKWLNRSANDIYTDCQNTIQVIRCKVYNEYLPYFQKINATTNIEIPELPSIPDIVFNDDKEFQIKQEKNIERFLNQVESIIRNHHKNLPIEYISDDKFNILQRYTSIGRYIRYTAENNKASADNCIWPDGSRTNWGYTVTIL